MTTRSDSQTVTNRVPSDAGYSLRCGPAAKETVQATLDRAVRPHLHDVRAMLRLPLPEQGITAGCNFAAVHVLLNILSGLSRLMEAGPTNSGKAFREFVERARCEGPLSVSVSNQWATARRSEAAVLGSGHSGGVGRCRTASSLVGANRVPGVARPDSRRCGCPVLGRSAANLSAHVESTSRQAP